MTDLGLSDPVDAAEALLDPVRVPGQVVVDHQVRAALQVDPLARRVVGEQEPHRRVVVEGGDRGAPPVARNAAVDHRHALRLARAGTDPVREILERVARLGEDDDLPPYIPGRGRAP